MAKEEVLVSYNVSGVALEFVGQFGINRLLIRQQEFQFSLLTHLRLRLDPTVTRLERRQTADGFSDDTEIVADE
jgi:hypothetical protein